MATMTKEEIGDLIAAAVRGALQGYNQGKGGGGGGGGGNGGHKSRLDERHFRRVKVFEGNELAWEDWVIQFKTQVRSADPWAGSILDRLQKEATGDPDWDSFFVDDDDGEVEKISADLFSALTT